MATQLLPTNFSSHLPEETPVSRRLPLELVYEIVEQTVEPHDTADTILSLSLVSKSISHLVDAIIYQNIVLGSEKKTTLFHQSISTKSADFLSRKVKNLSITWRPSAKDLLSLTKLQDILRVCTGVQKLVIPVLLLRPTTSELNIATINTRPKELVVEVYHEDVAAAVLQNSATTLWHSSNSPFFSSVKSLEVRDSSNNWYAPRHILGLLSSFAHVTHLRLVRYAGRNKDNDALFVQDVHDVLLARSELKELAVEISPEQEHGLEIFQALDTVSRQDERLVVCVRSSNVAQDHVDPDTAHNMAEHLPKASSPNVWAALAELA